MQKVFIVQETKEMQDILNSTYNELFAAVKTRNPKAEMLIDDEEYSQLHDLLALLRMGHIKVWNNETDKGVQMVVQILEGS